MGWGGDGESKHLLRDLAASAAAHLRHLLRREFHTGKIVLGASCYLQHGVWKREICLQPLDIKVFLPLLSGHRVGLLAHTRGYSCLFAGPQGCPVILERGL